MENKERLIQIYQSLLRITKTYRYYASYFQDTVTIEQVNAIKTNMRQQILSDFYFLSFYPEDCLQLAYNDKLEEFSKKKQ